MIYSYPKAVEVVVGLVLTAYVALVFASVACTVIGVVR